jgi:hypothetical protein
MERTRTLSGPINGALVAGGDPATSLLSDDGCAPASAPRSCGDPRRSRRAAVPERHPGSGAPEPHAPCGRDVRAAQNAVLGHGAASPAVALRRTTLGRPGIRLPFEMRGDACRDGSAVGQQEPGVPHDYQALVHRSDAQGAVACDTEMARPRDDRAANGTRLLTNGEEAFRYTSICGAWRPSSS